MQRVQLPKCSGRAHHRLMIFPFKVKKGADSAHPQDIVISFSYILLAQHGLPRSNFRSNSRSHVATKIRLFWTHRSCGSCDVNRSMPVVSAVRGSMKVTYKCLLWRLFQQLKLKVFEGVGGSVPFRRSIPKNKRKHKASEWTEYECVEGRATPLLSHCC